jgi:xanthine/uracil permease
MADLVYKLEDKPKSTGDWVLYSFQWTVTMFYAVVWGYAIVGVGLEFQGEELTRYMSAVVLTIGISTLVQAWLGHRMAMVSGPNVIPSFAIVAAYSAGGIDYALQSFMAQAIAGVGIAVLALVGIVKYIRKFWSPLILGSMIIMVGLAVAGTGLEYMVDGSWDWPFAVALALALGGSILAIRGKGVWATLPPLVIIGLGFLAFIAMGEVDFTPVNEAPLFTAPGFLPYGLSIPPWDLILIMLVVNLMAGLNLYGNLHGYAKVIDEEVPVKQEKRCFTIFGLVETTLPGLFGTPATVAFGENLGIVQLTRVAARVFIMVASVVFIVLAFFGPFSGLMAAIPRPIAGAVLLGIASTVIGIGADTLQTAPAFKRREQTLVGFSIFLSLGLYQLPDEVWQQAPRLVDTIFSNPIISVILFVILFEQVVFREKNKGEEKNIEEKKDKKVKNTA